MDSEKSGGKMKLSARNVLKGTIKEINFGVVNCEVVVNTTQGETIVSNVMLAVE